MTVVIRPEATDPNLAERIRNIRLVVFDFDGVFTDNMVYVLEDGSEAVRCFRGDGIGLTRLKSAGLVPLIISTEVNPVVASRSRKLGIECVQGCQDKLAALTEIVSRSGISLEQVAFVGNDINDADCLKSAGLPVVVRDAHPEVIPYAVYQTQAVGGSGAVREVCDMIWNVLCTTGEPSPG